MRRGFFYLVFSGVLIFTVCSIYGQERNLIKNGNFEEYKEGEKIPPGWIINTAYPCKVTIMEDKELAQNGKVFLRVDEDKVEGQGRGGAIYCEGFKVDIGEKYKFSVWAKGKGEISLYFYEYNDKGFIGSVSTEEMELTSQWKEYSFDYQPGKSKGSKPDVLRVSPAIHIRGTAYIDNAKVIKISEGEEK